MKLFFYLLFLLLLSGCTAITWMISDISNKIYPALQKPYDDTPPPTPTYFPASSEISSIIGGKGEGISCSLPIPSLSEPLVFDDQGPTEAPISLQFRQACAFHDFCYRHGAATYGYEQVDCDFLFQNYAYRLCRTFHKVSDDYDPTENCIDQVRRMLLGVRVGGGTPFQPIGKSTYFEFDPMPHKADDYTVSRLVSLDKEIEVYDKYNQKDYLTKSVVSFYYRRGTVLTRLLNWKKCNSNTKKNQNDEWDCELWRQSKLWKAFPLRLTPTPPKVVRNNNKDQLFAIAVNNFVDPTAYITEYKINENNDTSSDIISDPFIKNKSSAFWYGSINWLVFDELNKLKFLSFSEFYKNLMPYDLEKNEKQEFLFKINKTEEQKKRMNLLIVTDFFKQNPL